MARWLLAMALVMGGCTTSGDGDGDKSSSKDSDGDGLSDSEEADLGSDPNAADSDGDGLEDKAEVDAGSDPTKLDTDDDGYSDFAESHAGTDPADASSVVYTGGWPYNPNKDDLELPEEGARPSIGSRIQRFSGLVDQYGEEVDLYDFAGQGKMVIVDDSTLWCGWCHAMALWLGGENADYHGYNFQTNFQGESWYDLIPQLVNNGDVYWITFVTQDNSGAPAKARHAVDWYEQHPHEKIPVLADTDYVVEAGLNVRGFPHVALLDDELVFENARGDYTQVFSLVEEAFSE